MSEYEAQLQRAAWLGWYFRVVRKAGPSTLTSWYRYGLRNEWRWRLTKAGATRAAKRFVNRDRNEEARVAATEVIEV